MSDLKPCPCCGYEQPHEDLSDLGETYVECPECGLVAPRSFMGEIAYAKWNEISDAVKAYRHTCTVTHRREKSDCFLTVLSCGHEFVDFDGRVPKYCPCCGARVVGE